MDLIFVGIVLGIVQAVKSAFGLSKRVIPLTAIIVSLVVVLIATFLDSAVLNWEVIQNALIAGLSAVGLWETTKTSVLGK